MPILWKFKWSVQMPKKAQLRMGIKEKKTSMVSYLLNTLYPYLQTNANT